VKPDLQSDVAPATTMMRSRIRKSLSITMSAFYALLSILTDITLHFKIVTVHNSLNPKIVTMFMKKWAPIATEKLA
jgi:hypothetical protein